jgi:hypothetical protein
MVKINPKSFPRGSLLDGVSVTSTSLSVIEIRNRYAPFAKNFAHFPEPSHTGMPTEKAQRHVWVSLSERVARPKADLAADRSHHSRHYGAAACILNNVRSFEWIRALEETESVPIRHRPDDIGEHTDGIRYYEDIFDYCRDPPRFVELRYGEFIHDTTKNELKSS